MANLVPWQIGWQRHAARLSGRCRFALHAVLAQRLELLLNGCDIGIDGFIEQAQLIGVETFPTATKLPALEHRDLMGEHADALLFRVDQLVFGRQGLIALGDVA